jgi:hypothetical protein
MEMEKRAALTVARFKHTFVGVVGQKSHLSLTPSPSASGFGHSSLEPVHASFAGQLSPG